MPVSAYQVALGNNNAGGLATVSPQPRMAEPMHAAEQNYYGAGAMQFNGVVSLMLEWTQITRAARTTLLTAFGLSLTVGSALVTVRLYFDGVTWANYNATANYVMTEKPSVLGWTDFRVELTTLEAI